MTERKIKVLIKEPGEELQACEIPDTLEEFQRIVAGAIEVLHFGEKYAPVCNEEGKLLDLPGNFFFGNDLIVGTAFFAETSGEYFMSVRNPGDLREQIMEYYSEAMRERRIGR